jgi:hypothetical protein
VYFVFSGFAKTGVKMTAFDWREHIFQALSLLLPVHLDVYVLQIQVYC